MDFNLLNRIDVIHLLYSEQVNMERLCKYIPELESLKGVSQPPYHSKDVYEHTRLVVDGVPKSMSLKLAALLHDIAKPKTRTGDDQVAHFYDHENVGAIMAQNILGRLGFDPDIISDVYILISLHMKANQYNSSFGVKFLKSIYKQTENRSLLSSLCNLSYADRISDKIGADIIYESERTIELYNRVTELNLLAEKTVNFSPLSGRRIMEILCIQPSKEVGLIKEKLAKLVLSGKIGMNDESGAEKRLHAIYEKIKEDK